MFDIGLMEILLILIIALLVIGPERMPEVARKIGQFIGKTKRFINTMKEDSELSNTVREIQASMNLEDERKQLQDIRHNLTQDLNSVAQDIDLSEFQRPSFGGQTPETTGSSQFNKAPSLPQTPHAPSNDPVANKPSVTESAANKPIVEPVTASVDAKESVHPVVTEREINTVKS